MNELKYIVIETIRNEILTEKKKLEKKMNRAVENMKQANILAIVVKKNRERTEEGGIKIYRKK